MVYFVSALFCLPHPIWPTLTTHSQPTLRSPVRNRLKMQKQSSVLRARAQFCFFQGRLCGIKPIEALLDTSNQCNPQGLCWVLNEVHCSELESLSPRNGLTFFFSFVLFRLALPIGQHSHKSHPSRAPFVFDQSDRQPLSPSWSKDQYTLHYTSSQHHSISLLFFFSWIPPTHGFVHVRIILKTLVITNMSDRILSTSLSNLDTHTLAFYVSKTQVSESKHMVVKSRVCVCVSIIMQ